jgi:hypothetical protein
MKPIFSEEKQDGMLLVWNSTQGYLDASVEGDLLEGYQKAWVEPTDDIARLIDAGLLVLLDGVIPSSINNVDTDLSVSKKKQSSKAVTIQPPLESESQVVAPDNVEKPIDNGLNSDVSV